MVAPFRSEKFVLQSDGNLGAVEVATFFSLVLYGISLSQGYTYFLQSAKRDRPFLKALDQVAVLLILETFHSFTAAMAIYYDTITRWMNAEANSYPIAVNALLETLITLLVQGFFSYQIYKLSEKVSISIICAFLVLLRFIGGIAACVETFLDVPDTPENGINFVVHFGWLITSTFAVGSALDVLIAAFMTCHLRKSLSPWNSERTVNIINRLSRWSLQTGIVTSITSVSVIICFLTMPNMVWLGLYVILVNVYSNSLLVCLNARPQRYDSEGPPSEKTAITEIRFQSMHTTISIPLYAARSADFISEKDLPPTPGVKGSQVEV